MFDSFMNKKQGLFTAIGLGLLVVGIYRSKTVLCGLAGHDSVYSFDEANKIVRLHCIKCGWDSPGWKIEPKDLKFDKPNSQGELF